MVIMISFFFFCIFEQYMFLNSLQLLGLKSLRHRLNLLLITQVSCKKTRFSHQSNSFK